jgi:menaquinone-9 beta-reductase
MCRALELSMAGALGVALDPGSLLASYPRIGQTERHFPVRRGAMKIAVVGSGPAGSAAGFYLAVGGHEVTLMDRAAFPRDKTCGDWISPGAMRELARMGIGASELRAIASDAAPVTASLLAAPNATSSRMEARAASYCIPRLVFDDALRRRAVEAGCRIVRREVRDRDVPPLWDAFDRIIDARGASVARTNSAGLRAYWTVRREPGDDGVATTVQMFADGVYRLGYGWVFPVAVGETTMRLNVGVGAAKAECAGAGKSLPAFYHAFTRDNPLLRALAGRVVAQTRPVGYPVALAERRSRVVARGVLRIGDAGNLTDPLTGEGIATALASGRLAADALATTGDVHAAAASWQRSYEEALAPDFALALRLRALLTSTPAKNAAMWVLGRAPRLAHRFHDALSGTTRYRDLLSLRH